jgi:hypothetical protein
MARNDLRIYCGPEAEHCVTLTETTSGRRCVCRQLGDLLPLLAEAFNSQRTWLRDFEDDEIAISTDLYEVLLAYQHYRRPSA